MFDDDDNDVDTDNDDNSDDDKTILKCLELSPLLHMSDCEALTGGQSPTSIMLQKRMFSCYSDLH